MEMDIYGVQSTTYSGMLHAWSGYNIVAEGIDAVK